MNRLFAAFLLATASLSAAAHAAEEKAPTCDRFLPCGRFEGNMVDASKAGEEAIALEHLELAEGEEALTLKMSGWLKELDGKPIWKYDFVLRFDASGAFVVEDGARPGFFGSGFCDGALCSYALRPARGLSTTGSFAYEGGLLLRSHANKSAEDGHTLAVSRMKKLD